MASPILLIKSIRASNHLASLTPTLRHCEVSVCIRHYATFGSQRLVLKLNHTTSDTVEGSGLGVYYKRQLHLFHQSPLLTRGKVLENSVASIPSCSIQTRNFSLRDTLDSALSNHSSIFKSISESAVVQYSQNAIIQFHDYTGLPWWLTVILTTFIIRGVLTLPVALYQNHVIAKVENARIEMNDFINDLKYDLNREVRKGKWTEKIARRRFNMAVRKEWNRLVLKHNCHPAKVAILAIIQIPLWVMLSTAFRNMVYMLPHQDFPAQLIRLELSTGGLPWCPDLCLPDSFVLPIAMGVTNLVIIEMQTMIYKGERTKLQRYLTNFFRGFVIFMIPVAASVPSCLTLYWFSSSLFGLAQNLVVLSPRLRRVVGIPTTPSTLPHPYAHIARQVRDKLGL